MSRGFWIGFVGAYENWVDLTDVVDSVRQEWVLQNPSTFHSEMAERLVVGEYMFPGLLLEARGWVEGPDLSDIRSRIAGILSRGHRIHQTSPFTMRERQFVRLESVSGYRLALCRLVGFNVPEWDSAAPVEISFRLLCSVPRRSSLTTVNLNVPGSLGSWVSSSIPDDDSEMWMPLGWSVTVGATGGSFDIEFRAHGDQGRGTRTIRVSGDIPANNSLHVHGGVADQAPYIGLWNGSDWIAKPEYYVSGWFPTLRVATGRSVEVRVHSGVLARITSIQAYFHRRYYHL